MLSQMYLPHFDEQEKQALTLAIEALQEIQQYRALGTVKQIKFREAELARLSEGYLNNLTILREYQSLGTMEELRVARDKQVGKKVVFVHPLQLDDGGDYMCPSCKTGTVYDAYGQQSNHCSYCGQKLNWEEV